MKLLGSVIVASTIAKNHEKSCVGQNCGCNAEAMMRWKNEMTNWKNDQARWRYEFNLWRKETESENHVEIGNFDEELAWPSLGKCAIDDGNFNVLERKYSNDEITRQKCRQICTSGYFVYFGLENGTDCYCGNTINNKTKYVSISECNTPCSGNPSEFCGGASKMNILKTQTKCQKERDREPHVLGAYYPECWTEDELNAVNIGAYHWKQTWVSARESWCVDLEGNRLNTTETDVCSPFYTGQCLADLFGGRLLDGAHFTDDYLTREKCLDACKSAFYKYSGVEYGSECYCGNKLWVVGDHPRIIPDIMCNMPCSGDSEEKCGGENKLNIFNVKTKCEKERDDGAEYVRMTGIVGYYYPQCTESGEYEPSQYWGSTGESWCVDMNGNEIPGTRTGPTQEPKTCNFYYTGQCVSRLSQNFTTIVNPKDTMTHEKCKLIGENENSTYYAIGNGRDCFFGDTVDDDFKYLPINMCNITCGGDASEMCGGKGIFNLFSLKEN